MKLTIDLSDLAIYIRQAIESALKDRQTELFGWNYFSLEETCRLLQIKRGTLLDKRMPFLREIDYSQSGKIFWFLKKSVESFIESRKIRKYKGER